MEAGFLKQVMDSEAYRTAGGRYLGSPWDIQWDDWPYRERNAQPLMPPTAKKEIASILQSKSSVKRAAVYIHIPFCRLACSYCGFYKQPFHEEKLAGYVDSLIKEIRHLKSSPYVAGSKVEAVFFGGGTPGLLTPRQITDIMDAAKDVFSLEAHAEITMESSLSDMTEEKMEAAVQSGVNRFSFGVQSFDTKVRNGVGRPDTKERAIAQLENYTRFGADVVIDLIYGLEHQTEDSMQEDIRLAAACGAAGLDLYKLQILPSSVLGKSFAAKRKKLEQNHLQTLFQAAVDKLVQVGAKELSCTHWKMKDSERSLYNAISADGGDIFAFGMACGGRLGPISYFKTMKDDVYREEAGKNCAIGMGQKKGIYAPRMGQISSCCDKGVIDVKRLAEDTELPLEKLFIPVLETWQQWGLLYRKGDIYRYSPAGKYWYKTMRRFLLRMTEHMLYGMDTESLGNKNRAWQGMDNLK
ncbi:MAG: radical SAM protein [Dialister sp.]|nr:radical SAM protein [Dialister sp.]